MGNPTLINVESPITWNGTINTNFTPVKVKFHQNSEGTYYYRLHCVAKDVPPYSPPNFKDFYMTLGSYPTVPSWNYTLDFNVTKFQTMNSNGTMSGANPGNWFTSNAYGDSTTDQLYVEAYLQSSSNSSFSSYETSSESKSFIIKLGEDVFVPTWSCPTWIDSKYNNLPGIATLTDSNQRGVQGVSQLTFTISKATVSGGGANISSYTIAMTGGPTIKVPAGSYPTPSTYVRNVHLSAYPKLVGNVKVVFTVEDERGKKVSFTRTITIVPYTPLTLLKNDSHRVNGTGREVIIDMEGKWHGTSPGLSGQSLTLSCTGIVAKVAGSEATFANLSPVLTVNDTSFTCVGNGDSKKWAGVEFDSGTAYSVTATFTDTISTTTFRFDIPVGTPVLSVRDKKVGINNPSPSCALDVGGVIKMNDHRVFCHVLPLSDSDIGGDLNNCTEPGFYSLSTNYALTNAPTNLVQKTTVAVIGTDDVKSQIIHYLVNNDMYVRSYYSSAWHSWKQITLT